MIAAMMARRISIVRLASITIIERIAALPGLVSLLRAKTSVVAVEETSPPAMAARGMPKRWPANRSVRYPISPTPDTSTMVSQISCGLSEPCGP